MMPLVAYLISELTARFVVIPKNPFCLASTPLIFPYRDEFYLEATTIMLSTCGILSKVIGSLCYMAMKIASPVSKCLRTVPPLQPDPGIIH